MTSNPNQPHTYGPYQPQQVQIQYQSSTSPQPIAQTPQTQGCYNCGSSQHWAQYCPEPRRQVPAGSLNQKPRIPNTKPVNKKGSKPVITRYAPPPGYVPPQPSATGVAPPAPPPPPPPPPTAPYGQQPPYGTQPYTQPPAHAATQHWQQTTQPYTAAPQQWKQPVTAAPAFGPHPPAHQAYQGYAQTPAAYPTPTSATPQSPATGYPPQHQYPTVHQQTQGYPRYPGTQQPTVQPQQTTYPHVQTQQYPTPVQYPQAQAHSHSQSPYPQAQAQPAPFQPYQPPPMTTNNRYQNSTNHNNSSYSRGPHNNPRQNHHSSHNGHGHHNKGNRPKRFQPPPQPEIKTQRPPSPPRFFAPAPISTWKNGFMDRPLAAKFTEPDQQKPYIGDKGKNESGSKYIGAEGNSVKDDTEKIEKADEDPIWKSARTGSSMRMDMEGSTHQTDAKTEAWILELKNELFSDANDTLNSGTTTGETASDIPNGKKGSLGEGKKRNWEDYSSNQKGGGNDPERRPNKRRHDGRNRRGNRNRHGNKPSVNRNAGNDSTSNGTQQNDAARSQVPVHRSFHPLPPKPLAAPQASQTPSTNSENQPSAQKSRRSASPDRGQNQDANYRQRDYTTRIKQEEGGVGKKVSENADLRRHGAAAVDAYSRRW